MILTSAFAQWFLNILRALFQDLSFDFILPYSSISVFYDYLKVATYFFPLGTIRYIILAIFGLQAYRIACSLLKTIWAVLPIV